MVDGAKLSSNLCIIYNLTGKVHLLAGCPDNLWTYHSGREHAGSHKFLCQLCYR